MPKKTNKLASVCKLDKQGFNKKLLRLIFDYLTEFFTFI